MEKKLQCFPFTREGVGRSVVGNYRPVSLHSVVCKQLEHVIAGYLRQVWEMNGWLHEGQPGFGPRYSCENQVVTFYRILRIHGTRESGLTRK